MLRSSSALGPIWSDAHTCEKGLQGHDAICSTSFTGHFLHMPSRATQNEFHEVAVAIALGEAVRNHVL